MQFPQNSNAIASASGVGLSQNGPNSALLDSRYGVYQIGFDAVWELDFWGKYRRAVKSAAASYFATLADYDNALVALTAEVARTYALIRTYEVLILQARDNVAIEEEGQRIAESRFRNGATGELDVVQATTLLEGTRASIPELQVSLQQSNNALCTLLGRPSGCAAELLACSKGIPSTSAPIAVSVPAEMLRRRPDIRKAELKAIAQCEQIGIAKSELYPSLVLFGSIGTQTSGNGGPLSGQSSITNLFGPLSASSSRSARAALLADLEIPADLEQRSRSGRSIPAVPRRLSADGAQGPPRKWRDGMAGFLREEEAVVFAARSAASAEWAN